LQVSEWVDLENPCYVAVQSCSDFARPSRLRKCLRPIDADYLRLVRGRIDADNSLFSVGLSPFEQRICQQWHSFLLSTNSGIGAGKE